MTETIQLIFYGFVTSIKNSFTTDQKHFYSQNVAQGSLWTMDKKYIQHNEIREGKT